jgi:hypothetical protein
MSTPTTDLGGIQQTIRALKSAGWDLDYVDDGEEEILVTTEPEATDAITAVDQAWLHVKKREANGVVYATGYVFFVMGNDPEEVICDHTVNLSDVLNPLTDSWF